jgi:hypothetical protein
MAEKDPPGYERWPPVFPSCRVGTIYTIRKFEDPAQR